MKETSNFQSLRTIQTVCDLETGEIIESSVFFNRSEAVLMQSRRRQEEAISGIKPKKLVCANCGQTVRILGKKTSRGQVTFFAHLRDSEECEIKTDGKNSRSEIEIEKYSLSQESDRHIKLKFDLFEILNLDESKAMGISNVLVEKRITSEMKDLNWRKPDLQATFRERQIVFEIQLSTTFLSVIVARDYFYRMNKTFIIWIFNFSDNREYVNLENLMCKDIYYGNKRNAFILDETAIQESKRLNELILLCEWYEPRFENNVYQKGAGIKKSKYISLSDLKFDDQDFKPYYIDADKMFAEFEPGLLEEMRLNEIYNANWLVEAEKRFSLQRSERITKSNKARKKDEFHLSEILLKVKEGIYHLKPKNKSGKWGYTCDSLMIIAPIYSSAEDFGSNGLAKVRRKGLYGFIHKSGSEIIPCAYKEVFPIYNEKCVAGKKNEWFIIDLKTYEATSLNYETITAFEHESKLLITQRLNTFFSGYRNFYNVKKYLSLIDYSGNVLTLESFSNIEAFQEGLAKVEKDSRFGYINLNGEIVIGTIYSEISEFKDGKARAVQNNLIGYLNIKGQTIIPFSFSEIYQFENGRAKAKSGGNFEFGRMQDNGLWGFIDETGFPLIPLEFDYIRNFENGIAKVSRGGLAGFIDEYGNEIIPIVYEEIGEFYNKSAKVKRDGLYGYISLNGEVLIDPAYSRLEEFRNGVLKAKKNGLWGLIDLNGNETVPIVFENLELTSESLVKANNSGLWGCFSVDGKQIIPFIYDKIEPFHNEIASIVKNSLTGLISMSGEVLIEPIYEIIEEFLEGVAFAKKDGLWGILIENGKEVSKFIYNTIRHFGFGLVKVQIDNSWGLINLQGQNILNIEFQNINHYTEDILKVQKDGLFGLYDKSGRQIIPVNFDELIKVANNRFKVKKGHNFGYCSSDGNDFIECTYDKIEEMNDGFFRICKNGGWGYIDPSGKLIIQPIYDAIGNFSLNEIEILYFGKKFKKSGIARCIQGQYHFYIDRHGKRYLNKWVGIFSTLEKKDFGIQGSN